MSHHLVSSACILSSCLPLINPSRASDFGLVKVDKDMRITRFLEKPKGDDLKRMVCKI